MTTGALVVGRPYEIKTVGDTTWTDNGASAATTGVHFIALRAGDGTNGVATELPACRAFTTTELCGNGAKDNAEKDGDYGGEQCGGIGKQCALTKECDAGTDCASGICDTTVGMPVCVSCSDTITNGAETAVDCGGGVCDTCGERGACVAATDCTSKQCDANECTSCVNGVKDGVAVCG